jgi:hypothetical protein
VSESFKALSGRWRRKPGMEEIEMTLGWVIAYEDDPAAVAAFYERTYGLRKDFVVPGEYREEEALRDLVRGA